MRVLDIGFVKLTRFLASDNIVVEAAEISYESSHTEEEKIKLIKFLIDKEHGTPFEHCLFTFHVKAPLFVARQWLRHRCGVFNEKSGRYTENKGEFYMPDKILDDLDDKKQQDIIIDIDIAHSVALDTYKSLLKKGVKKELARIVLPQSMYTEFFWSVNARSLMNFLKQRLEKHAQFEIREYAKVVENYFATLMPYSHEAFENKFLKEV